jgi:hypothetical protein
MLIEKSFVNNYIYNKHNENEPMIGGYPVLYFFENNENKLDAKFENMGIPIGLVVEKRDRDFYGGEKHFNKHQNGEHELIDDAMFDKLIGEVSYHEKGNNNSTKKIRAGSKNKTKKM